MKSTKPSDITCPKCAAVGLCREGISLAVRTHSERVRRAKDLTRATEMASALGFEDGIPERSEIELLIRFGHDEDRPIANELLTLGSEIGFFEGDFAYEEDTKV